MRGRQHIAAASRGRRGSAGPVGVRFAAVPDVARPEVGYAIGRRVGTAVQRNRVRRRLRAVAQASAPTMVPGVYLVTAGPAALDMSFQELSAAFDAARAAATTGR